MLGDRCGKVCGIVGIVKRESADTIALVKDMTEALSHRGPDGSGIWHQKSVCLGHRRLSIIDKEGGAQPMVLRVGAADHAIVYNGEIYNYQELATYLKKRMFPCVTRSDTETLLRLLILDGVPKALDNLRGMFAFAWWNGGDRCMTLARDRLGIKPLYYHQAADGTLSFSSSLESLILNPNIEREVNVEALEYFFTLGHVPSPLTMYRGVYELGPAQVLTWRSGEIRIEPYWKIDWEARYDGTPEDASEHFSALFSEVVRQHLVSDVPVGIFLSGGMDSSSIAATAALQTNTALQAYTVAFPDPDYDESSRAMLVAQKIGLRHEIIHVEPGALNEDVCRFVLRHVGQPFADSSCIPTWMVSRAAAQHVKVVLSGDGGDEILSGYDYFSWIEMIEQLRLVPQPVRSIVRAFIKGLPTFVGWADYRRQICKALYYSSLSRDDALIRLMSIIDPEEIHELTGGRSDVKLFRLRRFLTENSSGNCMINLSRFLFEAKLPDDMLRKVDSMGMACSLEVRVPYLDHRLVQFAVSLPHAMKRARKTGKILLRRVMRDQLPSGVILAKQKGFSIPLHRFFDQSFFRFCRELLGGSQSQMRRLFSGPVIDQVLQWNETRMNPIPHEWSTFTLSHFLWMLVQCEMWFAEKRLFPPDSLGSLWRNEKD